MSGAGWSGYFDSVRTLTLAPGDCADPCDDDGDGLGDVCDGDDDGDLVSDLSDCAANDPWSGRPPDVPGLTVDGGADATISWDPAPTADVYDVVRGALASGDYGPCFADDVRGTSWPDGAVHEPGDDGLDHHPLYANFMDYGPEDRHKRFANPTLWMFGTYLARSRGTEADGRPADWRPSGNPFADQFPRYFPDLRG